MGNMLDYLSWRGDLSLAQDPFNEIDNLLLACLSYVPFEGIVPKVSEGDISIRDACEKFFASHTEKELKANKTFTSFSPQILKAMADSERFGNVKLQNYVNHIDAQKEKQFCALEILTDDGFSYVSIRGTDDTIIGWKEDFNLSYQTIPADQEAAAYLNYIMQDRYDPIRIGGHSKGAHIAIYAAAFCYPDICSRIEVIYENDGPGFRRDQMQMPELLHVASKIVRIIPETSIIGTLLDHFAEPIVVLSTENGVMQHSPISWQVTGRSFDLAEAESNAGRLFQESFNTWIYSVEPPERKAFIDDMFDVLLAPGVDTLSELRSYKHLKSITQSFEQINPRSKEIIDMLLRIIIGEWRIGHGLRV